MAFEPSNVERIRFFWVCVNPLNRWIAGVYGILSFITWCRDELLDPQWKNYRVLELLPNWPIDLWVTIGLIICIVFIGEGVIREKLLIEEAKNRFRPIFDSRGEPYQGVQNKRATKWVTSVIILIGIGVALIYGHRLTSERSAVKNPAPIIKQVESPTAIFLDPERDRLPIIISPHSKVHIIALNKRLMKVQDWGYYVVSNSTAVAEQWPNKTVLDEARKHHSAAVLVERAELSNHGNVNVLDVSILLKMRFGNEKEDVTYKAVITPLDAGSTFTVYLVNDCPVDVAVVWPDYASLQVLGESHRREVPLRRRFANPVEQLMTFYESPTRLVGSALCE